MKIDTCYECEYFIWPTEYRFYGHCLINDHYFLPDYMSCERFKRVDEVDDDIRWLLSLVNKRKEFAKACWECSHCDIFDKCNEENRNYCEKEQNEKVR